MQIPIEKTGVERVPRANSIHNFDRDGSDLDLLGGIDTQSAYCPKFNCQRFHPWSEIVCR